MVATRGTITTCAILVGNKTGEGDNESAQRYGRWSLLTGSLISIVFEYFGR
jgi:Na+-driven multidrug efflux pump